MNVVIQYLLLGCWWERHPFVTPGHTDTGRDDELSGGVKVTEWVNLGISTEAWLGVLDTAGWVSCMVILDHQVEEVLVVGVGVGSRVAGIDTNLAVSMERTWRKQTDDNWQTVKDNSNKGVDNRLPGYGSFFWLLCRTPQSIIAPNQNKANAPWPVLPGRAWLHR